MINMRFKISLLLVGALSLLEGVAARKGRNNSSFNLERNVEWEADDDYRRRCRNFWMRLLPRRPKTQDRDRLRSWRPLDRQLHDQHWKRHEHDSEQRRTHMHVDGNHPRQTQLIKRRSLRRRRQHMVLELRGRRLCGIYNGDCADESLGQQVFDLQ